MTLPDTARIGDEYALLISDAFLEWAKKQKSQTIKPFNPKRFISGAFYAAGEAQQATIGRLVKVGISFNLRSPDAETWIEKYAAEQVKYIGASTKATIRRIVLTAFQEGLTIDQQSKLIQQHVGLLPQHYTAVKNYEAALKDVSPDVRDRMVEKYRKKLLKYRADTIGLTEGHTASNEGVRQATKGAVDRGILSKDTYEQEWLYTPDRRTCDKCTSMNGRRAEIGGEFEGDGRGPPLHPRCRCVTVLRQK